MMKKYSEVGVKVQALQEELGQTEIECATADGGVVVKVTGTQVPISVEVSQELCDGGAEKAASELRAECFLTSGWSAAGALAPARAAESGSSRCRAV